jgi:hypothetical protein
VISGNLARQFRIAILEIFMKRLRSRSLFGLTVAAALLAASPAAAFNWSCIAKDRAGNEYEGRSFGLFSTWIKGIATDRAMEKCEEAGGKSCKLVDCVDLDVQPRT